MGFLLAAHFIQKKQLFFLLLILGVSTFQANPKEDDPVSWSNDAGTSNIKAVLCSSSSLVYLLLEPTAGTLYDGSLISDG